MVALVDKWEDPVYCTRMWTVFEQYKATLLQIDVSMILPPAQNDSFHEQLKNNKIKHVIESLDHHKCGKSQGEPC